MKKINVLFFGQLKNHWDPAKQSIQTSAKNIDSLYKELLNTASSEPQKNIIKVARNESFTDWNENIYDEDTIAFLPPASGG